MKKSKWILNLTLSIVTVMLAAEVLAKGGKNPSVRAGNGGVMHGSTVYGFNPSMRAAMRYQITLDRMRGTPNMSRNEFRKQKRQNRKQCIDTCKDNFGEFYDWAGELGWLSVGGALSSAGMSLLQNKTRSQLKREGLRMIHDPDPRKYKKGRFLLSWSNVIKGFGKLSFKVGLLATASRISMNSYCKHYKCGKGRG